MEIEIYLTILHTDGISVKIRGIGRLIIGRLVISDTIGVAFDTGLQAWLQGYAVLHDQRICDKPGIISERFPIGFRGAIDIQMVRVHRCHHRHIRSQVMERAVVLIRLHDHITAILAEQYVGAIIHADTSQEGIRAYLRLI